MRTIGQFSLFLVILNIFSVSGATKGKCHCYCDVYGGPGQNVCELLQNLERVSFMNSRKLSEWQELKPFVEYFSSKWKEEIANAVETKIDEYIASRNLLPKPEPLVNMLEDGMQNDSAMIPNSPKDEEDVVSNLLAKVEKVENKTLDMEEEMKSERRVRRHLEDEVNKTQSSLIYLSDQLQNVTVPVDAKMNQVESVLISTLDNMNKTIYEDVLKQLYYKVDGIVYKNETRELDERLEHIESELLDSDNSSIVSKLEEGFKTLEKSMYVLNSSIEEIVPRVEAMNDLAGDMLIPRIETLESDTVRKNDTDDLKIKFSSLLKGTELMRVELDNLSSGVLDIQNLKMKFENLSEQWDASLRMLQNEIEFLKNETLLRPPSIKQSDEAVSANEIFQQNELNYDTEDNRIPNSENYEDMEVVGSLLTNVSRVTDYDDLKSDVDYTTEIQEASLEQNGTNTVEVSTTNYEEYLTLEPEDSQNENGSTIVELYTSAVFEETTLTTEVTTVESGEIVEEIEEEGLENCGKPDIEDDHLLVDVVIDSYGKSLLKFGCHPIGLYKVLYPPVPPRCVGGKWKGPFPTCIKLAEMSSVGDDLGREVVEKISCRSIIFPDPTNCSQFFKCDSGRAYLFSCPTGLHFNDRLKVCDYPRMASCVPVKTIIDEKLETFIPPIYIEPDNIDKPSSHLGTGSTGQLIVHTRSSFALHCLYPENSRGYPHWNVTYTSGRTGDNMNINKGKNRVSVKVTAATEEDSGIYTCLTPFGVEHAIEVVVKVVVCPAFSLGEEFVDAYYRLTPEGELRIMGTRAEFQCEEGHRIFRQCLANGTWSDNGVPPDDQCKLKKRQSDSTWNCKTIDLSTRPDLIAERIDAEKKIVFKCTGGKSLFGNSYTRCKENGLWSQPSLPTCK